MPVRHAIWKVGGPPQPLAESVLASEQALEEMIVAAPQIISDEWMLIGQQEDTGFGGRIDLLAIAPDASLVLIELKRGRTPREVVAQALDYASWVQRLTASDIAAIYRRFVSGGNLADDFRKRFGQALEEESLNQSHQIVVVASSLDDSTERIVDYLAKQEVPINVLFFQVFKLGPDQLLSRAWLLDPVRTQISAATPIDSENEPWNGEFYASFGDGPSRSWEDARKLGFISAGGGAWYSKTLQLLAPGDRVWVKVPGAGFVGVGRATGRVQPARAFTVKDGSSDVPILDAARRGDYHKASADDPEKCEYFVPIAWLQTVPLDEAIHEIGLFGNQNSVCKPTAPKWRFTVDRLKGRFPLFDGVGVQASSSTSVGRPSEPVRRRKND